VACTAIQERHQENEMNNFRAVYSGILLAFLFFQSQAIIISGKIKESNGNVIEGVSVRLGGSGLKTTTDADGSFKLELTSDMPYRPGSNPGGNVNDHFKLENSILRFNLKVPAEITVKVYNCSGKLLFKISRATHELDCSIKIPVFANGIYLLHLSINQQSYAVRSVFNDFKRHTMIAAGKPCFTLEVPVASTEINEVLLCAKDGFQLYRQELRNTETSDMQITLTGHEYGTVTDIEGNMYRTVRYGNQIWKVENLRTKKLNDGSSISEVSNDSVWSTITTPSFCFYNTDNDAISQKKWGALYNWHVINTGKLAPQGWHVSSGADWDTLQHFLIKSGYNFDGTIEENKIAKSMSAITDWLPNTETGSAGFDTLENNSSGFTGNPGGYRDNIGDRTYRNYYGFWWTSTESDSTRAWVRCLSYYMPDLKSNEFGKMYGLPVRLVKN